MAVGAEDAGIGPFEGQPTVKPPGFTEGASSSSIRSSSSLSASYLSLGYTVIRAALSLSLQEMRLASLPADPATGRIGASRCIFI